MSLVASTQKLWYRRGALWNETKTKLGVSGSALVVVSFPSWQSSFLPDAPYLFLFLSGRSMHGEFQTFDLLLEKTNKRIPDSWNYFEKGNPPSRKFGGRPEGRKSSELLPGG